MATLAKYILVGDDDKVITYAGNSESWANLQQKNNERIKLRKSHTTLKYIGVPGTTIAVADVVQQTDDSTPFETLDSAVLPELTPEQIAIGVTETFEYVSAVSQGLDSIDTSIDSLTKQAVPISGISSVSNQKVIIGLTLTNETWKQLPSDKDLSAFVQAIHDPSDDTFSEDGATDPADVTAKLDLFKVSFRQKIDVFTDIWRRDFVTGEIIQQGVYEIKRAEAVAVDADSSLAGTSATPLLNKQVVKQAIHDSKTLADAVSDEVTTILAEITTWDDEAGRTEGIRIDAKVQINAAASESAMQTIYDQFVTDTESGS